MTPKQKAILADELLRNDIFDEAIKVLEERIVSEWKASTPDNWKVRERMYERLQALHDVKQQLETFIHTAALDETAKG